MELLVTDYTRTFLGQRYRDWGIRKRGHVAGRRQSSASMGDLISLCESEIGLN